MLLYYQDLEGNKPHYLSLKLRKRLKSDKTFSLGGIQLFLNFCFSRLVLELNLREKRRMTVVGIMP